MNGRGIFFSYKVAGRKMMRNDLNRKWLTLFGAKHKRVLLVELLYADHWSVTIAVLFRVGWIQLMEQLIPSSTMQMMKNLRSLSCTKTTRVH